MEYQNWHGMHDSVPREDEIQDYDSNAHYPFYQQQYSSWPGQPAVPLSTYSSLNGATSPEPGASRQSYGDVIDPQLTYTHQRQPYYPPQGFYFGQAQGTLSPHALHTPQPPYYPPSGKDQFLAKIRPLLQPGAFTGQEAVNSLVSAIEAFGSSEVDAQTRLDILTKIRDNGGNTYFRAWSESVHAIDITRDWLKAAFTGKPEQVKTDTLMPLLHIIDRLPFTLEGLKESKLGKLVLKLTKEPPNAAIQDMATNIERKWRGMLQSKPEPEAKKRKLEQPPAKAPPAKRTAVKESKSDSSFFSKPKAKLPSFKKAAPPPPGETAQPSSFNPFEEALRSMKPRKESPALPPPASTPKPLKKKKTVQWRPDDQLVAIRWVERAIYDDDKHGAHLSNSRDLDRSEGAAMRHGPVFEEAIDWTEPIRECSNCFSSLAIDYEVFERGANSVEKTTQEAREQNSLAALYMSPASIPDSPAEPSYIVPDEEVDKDMVTLVAGPAIDEILWSQGVPEAPSIVSQLVGQLTAPGEAVQGLNPDMLQQLLFQASQLNQPTHDGGRGGASRGRGRGGYRGKTRLCSFYAQGRCTRGDMCTFAHDPSLLPDQL